jgi:hypothetical protein
MATKSPITKLIETDAKFRALVKKYGRPRVRGSKKAPASKNVFAKGGNDICMMTNCYRGKRIVMRRDASGGCTRYSEEDC